MGLFEKARALQKTRKGLYHRLLELSKEEKPKSLYLKAKQFAQQLKDKTDINKIKEEIKEQDIQLPHFEWEMESPKDLDPELLEDKSLQEKNLIDPFEDWQKEAVEEFEKKPKDLDSLKQQVLEEEQEILTLPEEIHVASQKRIDYYLALMDIIEELDMAESYIEFIESIAFAIQEQLGTRSILVLGTNDLNQLENYEYIMDIGYEPIQIILDKSDPFIEELIKIQSGEILYLSKLKIVLEKQSTKSKLLEHKRLFENFNICFPIKDQNKIFAIFFLSNPLEQKDYVLDDLEFLRVLIKISISKIKQILKNIELYKNIQEIEKFNIITKKIYEFIIEASSKKNLDQLYDILQNFLEEVFGITMFSFCVLNTHENCYRLFSGKNISYESIHKFKLDFTSDLIGLISNLTTIHSLEDFKKNKEITECYTEEDLALMETFTIVPLIHLNWLIGFIVIHKKNKILLEKDLELLMYFSTILAPLITNMIIIEERELLFRDIFSPLKKRLEKEIEKAEELQTSFSVVDLRIKNLKRLLGVNSLSAIDKFLKNLVDIINSTLYQSDYLIRMGQGRFIIVLSGRSKEETSIYIKKLLSKIKDKNIFVESPVEPNIGYEIFTYPKDADNLKKILVLMEG